MLSSLPEAGRKPVGERRTAKSCDLFAFIRPPLKPLRLHYNLSHVVAIRLSSTEIRTGFILRQRWRMRASYCISFAQSGLDLARCRSDQLHKETVVQQLAIAAPFCRMLEQTLQLAYVRLIRRWPAFDRM